MISWLVFFCGCCLQSSVGKKVQPCYSEMQRHLRDIVILFLFSWPFLACRQINLSVSLLAECCKQNSQAVQNTRVKFQDLSVSPCVHYCALLVHG